MLNTYIDKNTLPHNSLNCLLHDVWEPWARKYNIKPYYHWTYAPVDWNVFLEFSCSIPNEQALDKLKALSPIIEIGSGSGYWAYLLTHKGADVVAVDNHTEHLWTYGNDWRTMWFDKTIEADGYKFLQDNNGMSERTLFLCWPRVDTDILSMFRGRNFVLICRPYIDPIWFAMRTQNKWRCLEIVYLPNWLERRDQMMIFKRR